MTKRKHSGSSADGSPRSTARRPPRPLFFQWWNEHRSRFLIDLQWESQDNEWMTFSFEGIHPALRGFVSDRGVTIFVRHAGMDWDLIYDSDIKPKRLKQGYRCELCEEKPPRVFPNRSTLFANHLCEPFLEWINEKLAKANWLVLSGIPEHVTCAELAIDPPVSTPSPKSEMTIQVMSLRSPFTERIVA